MDRDEAAGCLIVVGYIGLCVCVGVALSFVWGLALFFGGMFMLGWAGGS